MKADDKALTDELLEALAPLEVRARAMFGAWMVYVDDKPLAIVGDGGIFIKRSDADAGLADVATLAPPYPGAKDHWLLSPDFLRERPDDVLTLIADVAAALPAPKRRPKKA